MRPMSVAEAAVQRGMSEAVIRQCVLCGTLQAYRSEEGQWLVYQLETVPIDVVPSTAEASSLRAQVMEVILRSLEEEVQWIQEGLERRR